LREQPIETLDLAREVPLKRPDHAFVFVPTLFASGKMAPSAAHHYLEHRSSTPFSAARLTR